MSTDNKKQPAEQPEQESVQAKGQDFLKTDAAGAGSEGRELAGGGCGSSTLMKRAAQKPSVFRSYI